MRPGIIDALKVHCPNVCPQRRRSSLRLVVVGLAGLLLSLALSGCISTPAWGPNDRYVVVPDFNGGRMYKVNVDGSGTHKIAGTTSDTNPSISPDGRYILSVCDEGDTSKSGYSYSMLMLTDSVTGKTTEIGEGQGVDSPFAWRPDSARFAGFKRGPHGEKKAWFYIVSYKGVTLEVPTPPHLHFSHAIWLPHTDNIAVLGAKRTAKDDLFAPEVADVYTVEDGEVNQISHTGDVVGMGLSPDGEHLIWARQGKNLRYVLISLYRFNLDNRSVQRVPFEEQVPGINLPHKAPVEVSGVWFSPDGRHLAIECNFGHTVEATTNFFLTQSPAQLKKLLHLHMSDKQFKKYESTSDFTSKLVDLAPKFTGALYIVSMDGRHAKQIMAGNWMDFTPSWSHRGNKLAFYMTNSPFLPDKASLWVCNADGSHLRKLLAWKK